MGFLKEKAMPGDSRDMNVSIVIPVHNETANIVKLVEEINSTLASLQPFEIICVDDGSTDETLDLLKDLRKRAKNLRILRHKKRQGQTRALLGGIDAARAKTIVTMDGDGQNDPKDVPGMLKTFKEVACKDGRCMVLGFRRNRKDNLLKRLSSTIANRMRRAVLKDGTPDTGCGLKVFSRELFMDLPRFDHMHRFLPVLVRSKGGTVISVEVNHRNRAHGASHYGVWDRLWIGIMDLAGVWWLKKRSSSGEKAEEVTFQNGQ